MGFFKKIMNNIKKQKKGEEDQPIQKLPQNLEEQKQ